MACLVICTDNEINCSVNTLRTKSVILNELLNAVISDCEWCKPTIILPSCEARHVSLAVMCVETNVTSGLVVDRREAQHISDCLGLLGIPWEGESQPEPDHNQNLGPESIKVAYLF